MHYLLPSITVKEVRVRCHYVKYIESKFNIGSYDDVESTSLLTSHDNTIE